MLLTGLNDQLVALERAQRRRELVPAAGRDFASNDYLGLARGDELGAAVREALERGVPVGSGGSRLLRGNHPEHEALEAEAASFFGCESALFFSSGYAANSSLLSTLPQRGDLIIHDALIHASSHEGIRLARAPSRPARHNDAQAFADELHAWRLNGGRGQAWLVVESLYSMDGDKAPLAELLSLAEDEGAFLVVDEAHATGVFGNGGRGLAAEFANRENLIAVRTCGKALGCEGAFVCASRTIVDFLVNRSRGFSFSTAPSPLIAAAVRAALKIVAADPGRQRNLHDLFGFAAACLKPFGIGYHGSQILPLVVGDAGATMELARGLREAGFDVRGVRPPTVPENTSRIRISITLNVDRQAIEGLAQAIGERLG